MALSNSIVTDLALIGGSIALLVAEWRRPLRVPRERKVVRLARNLALASLAWPVIALLELLMIVFVTRWAAEHDVGLCNWIDVARPLEIVIALIALDYTLWLWHVANHKLAFLWRFHLVHHVDRDLDASTGVRFHFGEHLLSIGYRALQIVAIGPDLESITLWRAVLLACVLFHHSNVRLPLALERRLVSWIVTPRMHGIHHSAVRHETDSNWSSLLSVWDRLHRTLVLDVPQQAISIGVPAYSEASDVTLVASLALPMHKQRDDWTFPDRTQARVRERADDSHGGELEA